MRRRPKYYYIETFVYKDCALSCKRHYFYTRLRDFQADLFSIIKNPSACEYIRSACVLTRESSLYVRAHEELSKAYADGYTSICVFFDYGKFDNAPVKL